MGKEELIVGYREGDAFKEEAELTEIIQQIQNDIKAIVQGLRAMSLYKNIKFHPDFDKHLLEIVRRNKSRNGR